MAASGIAFLIFAVLISSGYSRPGEEKDDIFVLAAKKCNEEIKAPESAIEHLRRKDQLDDSKEGKCLIKCTLLTLGVIYEDAKINEDMRTQFVETVLEKPEDQQKLQKVIDRCHSKYEMIEDYCQQAFDFLICYYRESRKENIPLLIE